jgi:CheY-like chemotaxis protein
VERCVQSSRAGAEAQGLTLDLVKRERKVVVEGDAVRLEQVVTNLLTNALKYTPAGGSVTVTLETEGADAVLRVADDGVGITPEVLPRIFDLFVQGEAHLDRSNGGMGIGLTLVRAIVALHGGRVEASSAGSGAGSEFTVRLPRSASAEKFPDEDDPRPAALPKPCRIVLVEDNGDVREPLEMLLRESGHEVEGVSDGERGVEAILAMRPDVALVDIGLPSLDGYEVARRVRSALGPAVLLVALSGYGQPEDRRRALAAGFDAHFTKPVEISALEEFLAPLPR